MVQVAAIRKRFAAFVTLEWAPTVVPVQVYHQVTSAQKSLFADVTDKRPVFQVHLGVMIIVSNAGKALTTGLADKGLFT